jgi:hypothetical protein
MRARRDLGPHGHPRRSAGLLPLAVDGLIVAGSVILLAGSWLGWIGVTLGVAGTLYANVMSGLPAGRSRPPSRPGRRWRSPWPASCWSGG